MTAIQTAAEPATPSGTRPAACGLTVAILAPCLPPYASALAAAGARVLCADGAEAGLLVQNAPDMVIIDAPAGLSPRQIALLLAQLRWGCPDLVVLVASGMIGAGYGFDFDMTFDPGLGADHAADALAMARHLLCHSRLRDCDTALSGGVALLRRDAPRRMDLFR